MTGMELILLVLIIVYSWGLVSRIEKLEWEVRTLQVTKKDRGRDNQ